MAALASRLMLDPINDVRRERLPIVPIGRNMPHVFKMADRIRIHRVGRRHCMVDPKAIIMSDAVAIMTGAIEDPAAAN